MVKTKKSGTKRQATSQVRALRSNVGKTRSTSVGALHRPSRLTRTNDPGPAKGKARLPSPRPQRGGKNLEAASPRVTLQPSVEVDVTNKKKAKRTSAEEGKEKQSGTRKRKVLIGMKDRIDSKQQVGLASECVWGAAPASFDSDPPGKVQQKRKLRSDRSPSSGEAIVDESSLVTIVDLGPNFRSGGHPSIQLSPVVEKTAARGGKGKKASVRSRNEQQSISRLPVCITVPPQEDYRPAQSVVVIDLGSKVSKDVDTTSTVEGSSKKKVQKRKLSAGRPDAAPKHHLANSGSDSKLPEAGDCSQREESISERTRGGVAKKGSVKKKQKKQKSSTKSAARAACVVEAKGSAVALPTLESDKDMASTPPKKAGMEVAAEQEWTGTSGVEAMQETAEPQQSDDDQVEREPVTSNDPQVRKPSTGTEAVVVDPLQSDGSPSEGDSLAGPLSADAAENGAASDCVTMSDSSAARQTDGTGTMEEEAMAGIEELDVQAAMPSDTNLQARPPYRILKLPASDQCLLLLPNPSKFGFHGRVLLRVLHGSVTIMGFPMAAEADGRFYPAYSPHSSCALCIETSSAGSRCSAAEGTLAASVETSLKAEGVEVTADELMGSAKGMSVALIVRKMPADQAVDYVEHFPGFGKLFSCPETKELCEQGSGSVADLKVAASIGFYPMEATTPTTPSANDTPHTVLDTLPGYPATTQTLGQWLHLADTAPAVLVCGWKNTGKSTLCRFLANSLLPSVGSVCYLECDMAQTEFTPPGMLSLNLITQPLLGPPFTHLQKPDKMCFYGDVNVRGDPESYLKMVSHLLEHYRSRHANKPLIVNTMGWMQGLGLQLLVDIAHMVRPTHVVQLRSRVQPRAIPRLAPETLGQMDGWWHRPSTGTNGGEEEEEEGEEEEDSTSSISPELLEVEAPNLGDQGGTKFKGSDHRTMALLASLSDLQPSPLPSLPIALSSITPLVLPWRHVAVHVTNGHVPPRQVMYVLNGSVIGLCWSDPAKMVSLSEDLPKLLASTPVCQCHGLGVVRGIDPVQKVFYILTSLSQDALREVNTLLKGSLTLPQRLLTQGHRVADVPYVSREFSSVIVGSGAIKVRRNIKQRGR